MIQPKIQVFPDVASIAVAAAELIVEAANAAVAERDKFSIALSGGSTPKTLFSLLATDVWMSQIEWAKWHVYICDERCVPVDHDESNFRMIHQTLLSKVPIPKNHIHRIRGEIDPQIAAKEYGELLKDHFGDGGVDVALLGMGEDGHTASIFPHTPAVSELKHRCIAQFVEKSTTGRSWRITMTPPFLNRSANVLVLVAGASKAKRLEEVFYGPRDPERLPIQLIQPNPGKIIWLLDAAAAGMKD